MRGTFCYKSEPFSNERRLFFIFITLTFKESHVFFHPFYHPFLKEKHHQSNHHENVIKDPLIYAFSKTHVGCDDKNYYCCNQPKILHYGIVKFHARFFCKDTEMFLVKIAIFYYYLTIRFNKSVS